MDHEWTRLANVGSLIQMTVAVGHNITCQGGPSMEQFTAIGRLFSSIFGFVWTSNGQG